MACFYVCFCSSVVQWCSWMSETVSGDKDDLCWWETIKACSTPSFKLAEVSPCVWVPLIDLKGPFKSKILKECPFNLHLWMIIYVSVISIWKLLGILLEFLVHVVWGGLSFLLWSVRLRFALACQTFEPGHSISYKIECSPSNAMRSVTSTFSYLSHQIGHDSSREPPQSRETIRIFFFQYKLNKTTTKKTNVNERHIIFTNVINLLSHNGRTHTCI